MNRKTKRRLVNNFCVDCGKMLSQYKAIRCKSCSMRGAHNHFYGRKHTRDALEKIAKAGIGRKFPPQWYEGRSKTDDKHPGWKGDSVGYHGLHLWIGRKLGKPKHCVHCGSTKEKVYHWANVSGEYKRDLSDWKRLCVRCHSIMDHTRVDNRRN